MLRPQMSKSYPEYCFQMIVTSYSTSSVSSSATDYQHSRRAVLAWAVGPCCSPRAERQQHKKLRYLCCKNILILVNDARFRHTQCLKIIRKGSIYATKKELQHNWRIFWYCLSALSVLSHTAQRPTLERPAASVDCQ